MIRELTRSTALAALFSAVAFDRLFSVESTSSDLKITRLSSLGIDSKRWKIVGKNSHGGVHGDKGHDRVLLIESDA